MDGAHSSDSVGEEIRRRFGAEVDPGVTLDAAVSGAEPSASPSDESFRRALLHSRYDVRGEVARGGMGVVLEVWDQDLRRKLAMKVVLGRGSTSSSGPTADPDSAPVDPKTLSRFLEEAQVTGQLDHPGIVPVHELGLDAQGRAFFTMRLVRGKDLKEVFGLVHRRAEGWTVTRALNVLLRVCEAMAFAHAKGVIHRDLKPANIMVGRFGEVYVMDWGLARVIQGKDQRDLRLRLNREGTQVSSNLHIEEHLQDALLTMDGDVVGTPAYMSPEQARGEVGNLGATTDVYAVGAMLYHLLGKQMPFVPPDRKLQPHAIVMRVLKGPPEPLAEIAPKVPGELVAICERAMARDPDQRYADMQELGQDLRAYLEHRVVQAYETGAVAELRKWVMRNKPLAAALATVLVALAAGLVSSLFLKELADRNAVRAEAQREVAVSRRDDILRLSALQDLEDLQQEARELWPPYPELIPRFETWLERARLLVADLPAHEAQLNELRGRALSPPEAESLRGERAHPAYPRLQKLRAELAAKRRAASVRSGEKRPQPYELNEEELPEDPAVLSAMAWSLVQPDRESFGNEAKGLALARYAMELVEDDASLVRAGRTLSWALHANGLDQEALEEMRAFASLAPASLRPEIEESLLELRAAVEGAPSEDLADLNEDVARLQEEISKRTRWDFAEEDDRWWFNQLEKLVSELEAFAHPEIGSIEGITAESGWGVARRLDFAHTLEASQDPSRGRPTWTEAIATIADPARCPAYGGLLLRPQAGLVPLGLNPDSGLYEFAHLVSGEAPSPDASGEWKLEESTGIVLVLLPGGTRWIGAQKDDRDLPNYDPAARWDETPHLVQLSPYFLSKYELTQAQWLRMTGTNPSRYAVGYEPRGGRTHTGLHPVEQVTWRQATETLRWMGLALPTEAQWEFGCRAGTSSVWWTGSERDALEGACNLADRAATLGWGVDFAGDWPELDDGYGPHAPIGSYRPNGFGLHDVHGNVWEWCQDAWGDGEFYRRSPVQDPVHVAEDGESEDRVYRGGAFSHSSFDARSALRTYDSAEFSGYFLGIRPARALDP